MHPFLIDTHAHINFNAYQEDADEVIKRSLAEGVWMINVGSEYKTSQRAVDYAQKYPQGVYAAVGLHPLHLKEQKIKEKIGEREIETISRREEFGFWRYQELAQEEKVVAVGEIGLDYKIIAQKREDEEKTEQKDVFRQQIDLARQLDKPIILHCRQAYNDLLEILTDFQSGCSACPFACPSAGKMQYRGIVHCFIGSLEEAKRFLDLGLYLGFNGIITFSSQYDALLKEIPLERVVLETDCPYLTPYPLRGQRNEPINVKYVAGKIAHLKNVKLEEIAQITTKNTKELFRV